jgi:hypothetical protein
LTRVGACAVAGGGVSEEEAMTEEDVSWRHPGWPKNVKSMSWQGIGMLGIDDENRPYWDGQPIEIRRRLELTFWQMFLAWVAAAAVVVVAIGIVVLAINAGYDLGCKLHRWSCSPPLEHEVPPQLAPSEGAPHFVPGTKFQQR